MTNRTRRRASVAACLAAVLTAAAGPVAVRPDDPRVAYVGRFDRRDAAGPRCEWPASRVTVRLRGTGLAVDLADTGDDDWQVVVDGKATRVLHVGRGGGRVDAAAGLPDGEHTVDIVKRTEAFLGCGQFRGFTLPPGGRLLDPAPVARRIEVIGDSISCGYGNEATAATEHFSARTENAALAYGALAARAVDADYVCVAWSGKKVWPDNALPDLYDRTLPTDPTSRWDFGTPPPQAVLLNFGTNDLGSGVPDADRWTAAYAAFVRRVRGHYPTAVVYLASGPMVSDNWPPGQRTATILAGFLDRVVADLKRGGDDRVRLLPFGVQDGVRDGLGADYHPSLATDRRMADRFAAALAADLGWDVRRAAAPPTAAAGDKGRG